MIEQISGVKRESSEVTANYDSVGLSGRYLNATIDIDFSEGKTGATS